MSTNPSSITTKTPEEYLANPIDDQIYWYSQKSAFNQKRYKFVQVLKIILALAIPVLSLFMSWPPAKYIVGILGAFIAFLEGFDRIFNYKELWTRYRMTSEMLKHHKDLYLTKTNPYHHDDSFNQFVKNTQDIMMGENVMWKEIKSRDMN